MNQNDQDNEDYKLICLSAELRRSREVICEMADALTFCADRFIQLRKDYPELEGEITEILHYLEDENNFLPSDPKEEINKDFNPNEGFKHSLNEDN